MGAGGGVSPHKRKVLRPPHLCPPRRELEKKRTSPAGGQLTLREAQGNRRHNSKFFVPEGGFSGLLVELTVAGERTLGRAWQYEFFDMETRPCP